MHIAWLGPAPGEGGGVAGAGTELLDGLLGLGHRIDCFFPSSGQPIPARLAAHDHLTVTWGTSSWRWDRWYSRGRTAAFLSGLAMRGLASLRLRRQIAAQHRRDPFDLVYQFSTIESLGAPRRLSGGVPLVIHPETHSAGELRAVIAERRLGLRCDSPRKLALTATVLALRAAVQRATIGRANLLVCISEVFRDHLVGDYRYPLERTAVVPNPVALGRFDASARDLADSPVVLALGRVAARKGVEDVVALAGALGNRGSTAMVRVVGAGSLWSDYTPLLADLPAANGHYAGAVAWQEVPAELGRSDVLLVASHYEPFALTVAEALAAGVPVVGTSSVGALEQVDRSVCSVLAPGDVDAMATAVLAMVERVRSDPEGMAALARAEAERLFATDVVCRKLSAELLRLIR